MYPAFDWSVLCSWPSWIVAFVAELEAVGERLQQAQNSFNEARDTIVRNRGNVIRQAEMLKPLGVKPTKAMPQRVADLAADEDHTVPAIEVIAEKA